MTTAEKIKMTRKDVGLSQKEVAERLGITPANISQIESGKRGTIYYETIARLSSVFSEAAGKTISVENLAGDDFPKEYFKYYHRDEGEVDWNNSETWTFFYGEIIKPYLKLNSLGQRTAVERLEELTEIKKYQRIETDEEKMFSHWLDEELEKIEHVENIEKNRKSENETSGGEDHDEVQS